MAQLSDAYMDIFAQGASQPMRVPLKSDRLIIGRAPDAALRLDSVTVSRQHAELFKDPFGRWWVRDLGSRNGTRVNGQKIQEHLLEPSDILQVEDFTLRPQGIAPSSQRRRLGDTTGMIHLGDEPPGHIASLHDLEAPRISAHHIEVLSSFADELLTIEDPAMRLTRLCQLMVSEPMHGNTAVVLRISRHEGNTSTDAQNVICGPHSSRNWKRGELPYVSRTLLHAARQSKAPVVASNVSSGTGVVALSLAGNVQTVAAIACPLSDDDDPDWMDLLYITFPAEYGTGQWLALCALAAEQHRHADAAWDARHRAQQQALIETELRQANEIQKRLIPRDVRIPGLNVAIGFEPCKWVGGDYIDAVALPDGRALMCVSDVCGKGLQAALVTASLHTLIHTNITTKLDLADLINRLNHYLCQVLPDSSFVTGIVALLNPATGQLEFINAGHPPILVMDAQGQIRELEAGLNPPLGFIPDPMVMSRDTLAPGQLMMLYTDGLSEMLHHDTNEMLGIKGVGQLLSQAYASGSAVDQITQNFDAELMRYQGSALPQDDKAYLLAKRS